MAHSLADQFRRKAPRPTAPAPYKHTPPPPLDHNVPLTVQDNEPLQTVQEMPAARHTPHHKPRKKPKGTHVSETRPLRTSPQVTPVAQVLPGSPLSACLPPPQWSGLTTCSRNGLFQRPLSNVSSDLSIKRRNITHFSLKLWLCMLLATALLTLQINAYSAVAYNGFESNASNNFYLSSISVKRNYCPTLLPTNPNDYKQTISQTKIFQNLVPLNMICLYLLFFMLSINALENCVQEKFKRRQKSPRNNVSEHFFRYDILNFIHYLLIKLFYDVNSTNIYNLYSKFYISNTTMTGATRGTHSPFNPLFHTFNFSINSYMEGNNSISLITYPYYVVNQLKFCLLPPLFIVFQCFDIFHFDVHQL